MDVAQVLIDGKWRAADAEGTFHAENPAKGKPLPLAFPASRWSDCDAALTAATKAAAELRTIDSAKIAAFLDAYAANIEASADSIVAAAAEETALPVTPRLKDVELPRTTNQLRQAAAAVREESWRHATLDLEKNIRSCFAPIGPVVIFGPNNFPFAFNGVSGGDFAAAIAAGNPVIAKAHPLHPNTTRLLAEQAFKAVESSGLPPATVQLIYNVSNENGLKLVSDPRIGAVGFTGSRNAGLHLKRAAEDAGKPIYLEMSSINPVIFLPEALAERPEQLAQELVDSVLAGSGQFCTSPNLVLAFETPENKPQTESFLNQITKSFNERPAQPLLSASGRKQLHQGVTALTSAGAKLVTGGDNAPGDGYRYANTLLRATAATVPRRAERPAARDLRQRHTRRHRHHATGTRVHPSSPRRQPHRYHLLREIRRGRRNLQPDCTTPARKSRPTPQRQDAHRRSCQSRDESRRPVPVHVASRLYLRRNPHLHHSLRQTRLLRRGSPGASPRHPQRQDRKPQHMALHQRSLGQRLTIKGPPVAQRGHRSELASGHTIEIVRPFDGIGNSLL